MYFYIAFDKTTNTEYLLYKDMIHKGNIYYSEPMSKCLIVPIGTFLLNFLNIDFEGTGIGHFIRKYCYESIYFLKYPEKKKDGLNFVHLELNEHDYLLNLFQFMRSEKDEFIYMQNLFLKHLNLPYDATIVDNDEVDTANTEPINPKHLEFEKIWDDYFEQKATIALEKLDKLKKGNPKLYAEYEEQYYKNLKNNNDLNYSNLSEINGLINDLSLDFTFGAYYLSGINLSIHNIPYCFYSSDIESILAIEFKEFIFDKHHTIKKCKNCGKYFIPNNLRDIKYCNNVFENNKTCKQIGKELTYKKSLQDDKLLDMYRKRYLSLASSVSHYGTDKAIARFEKYKKDGAVMKKKYLNKQISRKNFEEWINSTKQN